jgi:two-component system response regulator GlrR
MPSNETSRTTERGGPPAVRVRQFRLVGAGSSPKTWQISSARCSIGSHPANDVVLSERTVSRFHCELLLDDEGVRLRDLESRNGTFVAGVRVLEAFLHHGAELLLGRAFLRVELGNELLQLPASEHTRCGPLVGASAVMRTVFALLERAAQSSVTVLLEGETGTGKEGAAEALHALGPRRDKPLVVVDCGSLPATLIETELFGHEKGAFTGALSRRVGAFEAAHGGTILLDEIGELPMALQPKLLRVLERKEIRRVGSTAVSPVDVRVVAATNRDLRTLVNRGEFRPDLYFRLAVVRIQLPPLRQRLTDIPRLAEKLVTQIGAPPAVAQALLAPEFLEGLSRSAWPGNVRELRNFLERCALFHGPMPLDEAARPLAPATAEEAVPSGSYTVARRKAIDEFERRYLEAVLARHAGRVAGAAEEAGVDRVYLYRLMRKHGLPHPA